MRWVLPDHIQDALPSDAHQLEALRRRLLDAFRVRGYQLVMPPLLEYLDSLTTGAGRDLALRTFTLVDQLSGRTMGVRADMTPRPSSSSKACSAACAWRSAARRWAVWRASRSRRCCAA